jgi:hypothetical protein
MRGRIREEWHSASSLGYGGAGTVNYSAQRGGDDAIVIGGLAHACKQYHNLMKCSSIQDDF